MFTVRLNLYISESSVEKVRQEIKDMKNKFAELKNATCSAVEKEKIHVSMLVDKIVDLPVDFEEHDQNYLKEHSENLRNCPSVPALFVHLRFHWDYLHPDLYSHLVEEFKLSSVSPKVEVYQRNLDGFLDRTPLEEFCEVEKMRQRHINCNTPEGFAQIVTGHCWDPPIYLRDIENFRVELADYFCLKKCAVMVVAMLKGSAILAMWVPESIESKIKSVDPNFISKHAIVYMEFQCSVVYKVSIIMVI